MQGFAEFAERIQGVAAVADAGLNNLMIHAAKFLRPLLENLTSALLYRKVIVAADER